MLHSSEIARVLRLRRRAGARPKSNTHINHRQTFSCFPRPFNFQQYQDTEKLANFEGWLRSRFGQYLGGEARGQVDMWETQSENNKGLPWHDSKSNILNPQMWIQSVGALNCRLLGESNFDSQPRTWFSPVFCKQEGNYMQMLHTLTQTLTQVML